MDELEYQGVPALLPVSAGALRATWVDLAPHVHVLANLAGESWLGEDVFHEIVVGNAHLWALSDNSGFVVFRLFASAYSRDLFVWLCWKREGEPAAAFLPQLLEIARANDCARITWESPRAGFIRALPGVKRNYSYSIDVGD